MKQRLLLLQSPRIDCSSTATERAGESSPLFLYVAFRAHDALVSPCDASIRCAVYYDALFNAGAHQKNRYGVLSTYVQSFDDLGKNLGGNWEVAHLCEVEFPGSGQPRNKQARVRGRRRGQERGGVIV